jgi:hypothetical protein
MVTVSVPLERTVV